MTWLYGHKKHCTNTNNFVWIWITKYCFDLFMSVYVCMYGYMYVCMDVCISVWCMYGRASKVHRWKCEISDSLFVELTNRDETNNHVSTLWGSSFLKWHNCAQRWWDDLRLYLHQIHLVSCVCLFFHSKAQSMCQFLTVLGTFSHALHSFPPPRSSFKQSIISKTHLISHSGRQNQDQILCFMEKSREWGSTQ